MKKKLLPILLASLALLPQASRADSKQMFASLVFTSSRSVDDVQLYMPTEGQRGPVVKFGEKRLYVGKRGFALNGLKGLSFHMEVVSGVRDFRGQQAVRRLFPRRPPCAPWCHLS